ncbi:NAD(P)/FAD-dependent oxidoreductase [Candidatus Bipolaricaulota bacterium]|nr:NAD(P)/FAD-dependent oxidoreductase [Candidatus Bipolaricaulota bacterium]
MKTRTSVAIVGAGVSGLSAGCYTRMNGFDTRIYEMNNRPGGLCSSWEKDGYRIDVCLRSVDGCGEPNPYHRMWRELGIIDTQTFIRDEALARVEDDDGRTLILYSDAKRLRQHLAELAPEDRDLIHEFTRAVRRLGGQRSGLVRPKELASPISVGKRAPRRPSLAWMIRRWSGVTIEEFAESFDSPFLRRTLPLVFSTPDTPVLSLIQSLSWMNRCTTGRPSSGSDAFVRSLERRFTELGGEIDYGSRVERVLIEHGRAAGLRLVDGRVEPANVVIVASDCRSAVQDLLSGGCPDEQLVERFDKLRLYPSMVCVAIGVNRSIEAFPSSAAGISFPLAEPKTIDGRKRDRIVVHAAESSAPRHSEGSRRTVLFVLLGASYDEWVRRESDERGDREARHEIVQSVIDALEERFPRLSEDVEMTDIVTPPMWRRRTGNWDGSTRGWLLTPETLRLRMPRSIKGVDGLFLAGQWTEPGGGVSRAAMSGRYAAELVCRDRRKRFATQIL